MSRGTQARLHPSFYTTIHFPISIFPLIAETWAHKRPCGYHALYDLRYRLQSSTS